MVSLSSNRLFSNSVASVSCTAMLKAPQISGLLCASQPNAERTEENVPNVESMGISRIFEEIEVTVFSLISFNNMDLSVFQLIALGFIHGSSSTSQLQSSYST
eukprot:IDg20426t1